MRRFKPVLLVAILFGLGFTLMSAIPASKGPVDKTKIAAASAAIDRAAADGNVTYKELKDIASELKGEKLSLKEKIALRVFKKKITNQLEEQPLAGGGKSQLIALILCALVGGLGIHRFYLGYTWQGIVQLLTLGGCGIWALIDLIRIITGSLQPKDGEYETTL